MTAETLRTDHGAAAAPPEARGGADDESLVRRIAVGDRGALAALYDRHVPVLLALAERMLASRSDAEDLVHDVCLEVWRKANTYEPSRGSVRAWLVMRLRSRALDRLRAARRTRLADDDSACEEEAAPSDRDPSRSPDHERVRRALGELPEDQRAVLDLAYFEGLSLPEIGERLSIPVGTVKSRLSRAIGKLRADLQA